MHTSKHYLLRLVKQLVTMILIGLFQLYVIFDLITNLQFHLLKLDRQQNRPTFFIFAIRQGSLRISW